MKIASDWHIHSRNSCDAACMAVSTLLSEAPKKGIRDFGLTDHIHTPYNLPDLGRSRAAFVASDPPPAVHFGVEVSCVSRWELDEIASGKHDRPVYGLRSGGQPGCEPAIGITPEQLAAHHVEYVVGGTHWPLYVPWEREAVIRDYHRQNMFLATHPLVDIVAHPWWWMGHWKDDQGNFTAEPWFDDFGVIPPSMHDEFAAAAIESGTAVEVNIAAVLLNPHYPECFIAKYLDYLAGLQSRGVRLSIGSDCHSEHYAADLETVGRMLDSAGISDDFWALPSRDGTAGLPLPGVKAPTAP